MFGSGAKKISLDETLYQKLKVAAGIIGCSVDEFVAKILDQEAEKIMTSTSNRDPSAAEVEEIANRLKGLGYLD